MPLRVLEKLTALSRRLCLRRRRRSPVPARLPGRNAEASTAAIGRSARLPPTSPVLLWAISVRADRRGRPPDLENGISLCVVSRRCLDDTGRELSRAADDFAAW